MYGVTESKLHRTKILVQFSCVARTVQNKGIGSLVYFSSVYFDIRQMDIFLDIFPRNYWEKRTLQACSLMANFT